jgi:hypothetical protein
MRFFLALLVFIAACGCQPPRLSGRASAPHPRPVGASAGVSIGRLDVTMIGDKVNSVKDTALMDKFGTAWSAGVDSSGRTLLVTAGHVCPDLREIVILNGEPVRVREATLTFVDHLGTRRPVKEVFDDNDSDVCVLVCDDPVPALRFSPGAPVFGDRLTYVGYPAGDLAIIDGRFIGTVSGRFVGVSLNSIGGASGSPVLDAAGLVVGMVVQHRAEFDGTSFIVPLERLRKQVEEQRSAR